MSKVELPVVQDAPVLGRVSCLQCAKCCTYVAVGINAPTTPKLATEILWHLYHQGVTVCRDEAGEWYVQFEARCRNLGEGNLCTVYLNRPHICRAYDDQSCEVNAPQAGLIEFKEPRQFLDYLKSKRPKVFKAIERKYVPEEHQPAPTDEEADKTVKAKAAAVGAGKRASAKVR